MLQLSYSRTCTIEIWSFFPYLLSLNSLYLIIFLTILTLKVRQADIRSREIVKNISATDAIAAPTNELEFLSLKKNPFTKTDTTTAAKTSATSPVKTVFEAKTEDFPSLVWARGKIFPWNTSFLFICFFFLLYLIIILVCCFQSTFM